MRSTVLWPLALLMAAHTKISGTFAPWHEAFNSEAGLCGSAKLWGEHWSWHLFVSRSASSAPSISRRCESYHSSHHFFTLDHAHALCTSFGCLAGTKGKKNLLVCQDQDVVPQASIYLHNLKWVWQPLPPAVLRWWFSRLSRWSRLGAAPKAGGPSAPKAGLIIGSKRVAGRCEAEMSKTFATVVPVQGSGWSTMIHMEGCSGSTLPEVPITLDPINAGHQLLPYLAPMFPEAHLWWHDKHQVDLFSHWNVWKVQPPWPLDFLVVDVDGSYLSWVQMTCLTSAASPTKVVIVWS